MKELSPRETRLLRMFNDQCRKIANATSFTMNETHAEKQERINHLLKPGNEEAFCRYYFSHYVKGDFAWFHRQALENVFVKRLRNHIWEWPRESAKTVFSTVFIPTIHFLRSLHNQDKSFTGMILGSRTGDKAKNAIKSLQAELSHNQKIKADFPDLAINGSWLQGYFQSNHGQGFWAFGLGEDPAGVRESENRPSLGIVTDADNKKQAKNQALTLENVDWILGEFMGCLQTKGRQFIYENNRVAKDGITAHMAGDVEEGKKLREGFTRIKVYFTEHKDTGEPIFPIRWSDREDLLNYFKRKKAVPAWQEYFTLDEIVDKIIDMGYRNAMRQLYHTDIKEGTVFTNEMLPWGECLPLHMYDALVSYCDPAYGQSKSGCYRALVLVGLKDHYYHIIWAWLRQNEDFAKAQYELDKRLRNDPGKFRIGKSAGFRIPVTAEHWVECNSLQKEVLKYIYRDLNSDIDEPWYPRFDNDVKGDKIGRIEALETIASKGHIIFNIALKDDPDMIKGRDQFLDFPNGFRDFPDAFEGAKSKLHKKAKSKTFKAKTGKFKRQTNRLG